MDPFATHVPVLAAAITGTTGSVLEVGTGPYSNLLMRALARDRLVMTLENDLRWLADVRNPREYVSDWSSLPARVMDQRWGCVFVDCAPAEARVVVIRQLAPLLDGVLVIHDSESSAEHVYRYSTIYSLFQFVRHWRGKHPTTTVLTNNPALVGIIDHVQ